MISTFLRTDGRMHDLLYVDGGPSQARTVGKLRMLATPSFAGRAHFWRDA